MDFSTKVLLVGIIVILGLAAGFFFLWYLMADAPFQGSSAFNWAVAI